MRTQTKRTMRTEETPPSSPEAKPPAVELSLEAALLRPSIAGAIQHGLLCG